LSEQEERLIDTNYELKKKIQELQDKIDILSRKEKELRNLQNDMEILEEDLEAVKKSDTDVVSASTTSDDGPGIGTFLLIIFAIMLFCGAGLAFARGMTE